MSSAEPRASVEVPVLAGKGKVQLPGGVFAEPFHGSLVHEVVRAELAARRRGTAATRTRGEARGGGAKPWRQKGTGRARIGSIRAPHWTGGGAAFGPSPRRYTVKVNRKARRKALRCALSLHAGRGSLALVEASSFDEPSTSRAVEVLESRLELARPVLVLVGEGESGCSKSFRNIQRVGVAAAGDAGVADVMGAAALVISRAALERLEQLASASGEAGKPNGGADGGAIEGGDTGTSTTAGGDATEAEE